MNICRLAIKEGHHAADQIIVDEIAGYLIDGNPNFNEIENATPRHALAATMFAFEKDRSKAALINRTFLPLSLFTFRRGDMK